eukprot:3935789-Rhodomonas_salina.1
MTLREGARGGLARRWAEDGEEGEEPGQDALVEDIARAAGVRRTRVWVGPQRQVSARPSRLLSPG